MQDRYVGDVGDFGKYAFLRRLSSGREAAKKLGIIWCLFPNEAHNNDGRHVSYLTSKHFSGLDDPLLAKLRHLVSEGHRSVSDVRLARIFSSGTIFCDALATISKKASKLERLTYRKKWLQKCLSLTEKCDLVFFDPDNGLEAKSIPKGHPKSGKYIYWDELIPFWRRGQAMVIYHHLNRKKPHDEQVLDIRDQMRTEFLGAHVRPVVFKRGSSRVFWLVHSNDQLGQTLESRISTHLIEWAHHFRPVTS